jgi:hypothetical protein
LHSADGGQTWDAYDTGQPLPLRAVTFLDEYRGWAVGSLGTILATRDGGRSWAVQRRGGDRTGWLCIASQIEQMPLELCVKLGGNDGYLGAVEVVTRIHPEEPPLERAHLENRLHESVIHVGGSASNLAWEFPLPTAGNGLPTSAILGHWDNLHHGHSLRVLQENLVRKIRQWRPDVIITDPIKPQSVNGPAGLINQAVLAAVDAAADPTAEADQALVTGLSPWRAKKVFGFQGPDQKGSLNLTTSQLATRLGQPIADQARDGWRLIYRSYRRPADSLGFQLLVNRLPVELGKQDFFSGIAPEPGQKTRRQLGAPPPKDVRSIGRLIQRRGNIQRLLQYASAAAGPKTSW